jgi:hypothetical protein
MHGGTAALLDERLGSTAGQAAARSSFVPKLRTLDEKLRMASTAMSSFIRLLLH